MYLTGADYSKTFRTLSEIAITDENEKYLIDKILLSCASVKSMKHIYRKRETSTPEFVYLFYFFNVLITYSMGHFRAITRSLWILQTRPDLIDKYAKKADDATSWLNSRKIVEDVESLTDDIKRQKDTSLWKEWLFEYKKRLEIETMSSQERLNKMKIVNPRFILKNYILQNVIKEAEKGNFEDVETVLELISHPFKENPHQFCKNRSLAEKYISLYDEGRPVTELRRKIT